MIGVLKMVEAPQPKPRFQFRIIHLMIFAAIVAVFSWTLMPGKPIDSDRAAEVPVVLRINNNGLNAGSKYTWNDVEILDVFKNTSETKFAERIEIASYGWGVGMPGGVSTVYLVPYNSELPTKHWKLNEQDGKTRFTGFTHTVPQKK